MYVHFDMKKAFIVVIVCLLVRFLGFVLFFRDKTLYVVQADRTLRTLLFSAFQALGLQGCVLVPS